MVAQQLRGDALDALRPDRRAVVDAVLDAELDPQQPQEMPRLGGRRDGALPPAARQPLLDGDGRRDARHRVDLGPARRLHDAARIGVERFEIAPLALVEQDVEGQRRLARARHAGDDVEAPARYRHVERLQVVLAGIDDADRAFVGLVAVSRCASQPPPRRRRPAPAARRPRRRFPARAAASPARTRAARGRCARWHAPSAPRAFRRR